MAAITGNNEVKTNSSLPGNPSDVDDQASKITAAVAGALVAIGTFFALVLFFFVPAPIAAPVALILGCVGGFLAYRKLKNPNPEPVDPQVEAVIKKSEAQMQRTRMEYDAKVKETDDASALQLRNSIDKIEAEWREWLNMHYPNFAETLKDPEQARQEKKELIAQLKEKIERINNSNDEAEKATVPALTEDLLRIQGEHLAYFQRSL